MSNAPLKIATSEVINAGDKSLVFIVPCVFEVAGDGREESAHIVLNRRKTPYGGISIFAYYYMPYFAYSVMMRKFSLSVGHFPGSLIHTN